MSSDRQDIIKALIHVKIMELFSLLKTVGLRYEVGEFCGLIKCNRTHEVLGKLYDDEVVWERDLGTDMSDIFGRIRE